MAELTQALGRITKSITAAADNLGFSPGNGVIINRAAFCCVFGYRSGKLNALLLFAVIDLLDCIGKFV